MSSFGAQPQSRLFLTDRRMGSLVQANNSCLLDVLLQYVNSCYFSICDPTILPILFRPLSLTRHFLPQNCVLLDFCLLHYSSESLLCKKYQEAGCFCDAGTTMSGAKNRITVKVLQVTQFVAQTKNYTSSPYQHASYTVLPHDLLFGGVGYLR